MTGPRAARARGTAWETALITYLKARGWRHAERRTLAGAKDRGDIAGIPGVCIEAKNAARIELAAWLDEAKREAAHTNDLGAVWFKRRGHTSPANGFVLMDGDTFTRLLDQAGYRGRPIDTVHLTRTGTIVRQLLVLTEQGVSQDTALQWKDQLQERLGIPVIVLAGAKQALIIETTAVDEAK